MRTGTLFISAAAMILVGSITGSTSATAGAPLCISSFCLPGSGATESSRRLMRVADNDSSRERFRRQRIRMCCARYEAGLPLKGQFCSYQIVVQSYERKLCTQ